MKQHHGEQIAEGKTKVVYAHPTDPNLALLAHKDGITAGDGARRNQITGKGALAGRTTANVFRLLNAAGIPTHFVAAPEPTVTVVRRCEMIPLEVVRRRLATGSYLKRKPEVGEGTRFDPPLVEFFLKDDARHDPLITEAEIVAQAIATSEEVASMVALSDIVFTTIERAWAAQDVTLVDLKIEFGRPMQSAVGSQQPVVGSETTAETVSSSIAHRPSSLLVSDVIDNDSWRIWPGGEKGRMLDKQVYRNAQQVDAEVLDEVRRRYAIVAELTDSFG